MNDASGMASCSSTTDKDAALLAAIRARLVDAAELENNWRLEDRPGIGRTLVAARFLPAGTLVFREQPLVVATATNAGDHALRGGVPAVALALMCLPPNGPASLLQQPRRTPITVEEMTAVSPAEAAVDEELRLQLERRIERASDLDSWVREVLSALNRRGVVMTREDGSVVPRNIPLLRWALGVASVNSHGAGRGFDDSNDATRGVLGLLCSMMEHSCVPSSSVYFAPEDQGSVVSLRARRDILPNEALSIAYVCPEWTCAERRRVLLIQHGFVCGCPRCVEDAALEVAPEARLEPFLPMIIARAARQQGSPLDDHEGDEGGGHGLRMPIEMLHWPGEA